MTYIGKKIGNLMHKLLCLKQKIKDALQELNHVLHIELNLNYNVTHVL